jgi:heptosyltransferase III
MISSLHNASTPTPQSAGKPRILILRGGSIGDFVFTLPAFTAVRKQWPKAYIELVGYPHIAQLAVAGGLADSVFSLESANVARYFAMGAVLDEKQTEYIRSFDLIISYLYDPIGTLKENLLNAGARQVIYGDPRVLMSHAIDVLMKPLEELAIYPEGGEFSQLAITDHHRKSGKSKVERVGERVVALHPGSGSPKKNWPLSRFVELGEKLRKKGIIPVFTLGEADREIAVELERQKTGITVLPTGSLLELAEFLFACSGYVGNDSGITHLAAALGIPVVAIFGPTEPDIWAPRSPNAKVITSSERTTESLASVSVEQVFDEIRAMLR